MVSSKFLIADMFVFPLRPESGHLTLLRNSDHLLRRFGQLDLLDLSAGQQTEYIVRAEADRFLFPIAGEVSVTLVDLRQHSPSRGIQTTVSLNTKEPQGVLVPFGVACSLACAQAARLVQLSTHSESHAGDRIVTPDELGPAVG